MKENDYKLDLTENVTNGFIQISMNISHLMSTTTCSFNSYKLSYISFTGDQQSQSHYLLLLHINYKSYHTTNYTPQIQHPPLKHAKYPNFICFPHSQHHHRFYSLKYLYHFLNGRELLQFKNRLTII